MRLGTRARALAEANATLRCLDKHLTRPPPPLCPQFRVKGCENCPRLAMEESHDRVRACTTANFNGHVVTRAHACRSRRHSPLSRHGSSLPQRGADAWVLLPTSHIHSLISIFDPNSSWAAKWLRLGACGRAGAAKAWSGGPPCVLLLRVLTRASGPLPCGYREACAGVLRVERDRQAGREVPGRRLSGEGTHATQPGALSKRRARLDGTYT